MFIITHNIHNVNMFNGKLNILIILFKTTSKTQNIAPTNKYTSKEQWKNFILKSNQVI